MGGWRAFRALPEARDGCDRLKIPNQVFSLTDEVETRALVTHSLT